MQSIANNTPVTLKSELDEFIIDRQARNLSPRTVLWYTHSLNIWAEYTLGLGIHTTQAVSPSSLRQFLLYLKERGHNAGGVNNIFGAVKAFLNWYADEAAPAGWQNPLLKVKNPKRAEEPLEPLLISSFRAMLAQCTPRTFSGDRDRALLLMLLDTGVRHQELTDLSLGDVDLQTGSVLVRCGQGRKPRTVFIGAKTRRAIHRYFHHRDSTANDAPLWVTLQGERLTKGGVREIIRRRAKTAGIKDPAMHTFRSKRPLPPWLRYLQTYLRKAIETTGSLLERLLPESIHAVTAVGFELKVVLFVLALSISRLPL